MTEVMSHVHPSFEGGHSSSITRQIGNTPIIEIPLNVLTTDHNKDVKVLAKAEWFNPGGSVKDRPAWNMIKEGLVHGELSPGMTIIDASSGNTGIALSMIGASLGYEVTICIPKNASPERINMLRAYGANLILTDPLEGTDGAIIKARELVGQDPDKYFYTDQYNNFANWMSHYLTTAPEILEQTNYKISHFVAGLGTSGTFVGTSRRLLMEKPDIKPISMQPDTPFHGLEGLKHMETAMTPGIYDPYIAHENVTVTTEEAQQMTVDLARKAGILVGTSSGANVVASLKVASKLEKGVIVTLLCDRGERYMSEKMWRQ